MFKFVILEQMWTDELSTENIQRKVALVFMVAEVSYCHQYSATSFNRSIGKKYLLKMKQYQTRNDDYLTTTSPLNFKNIYQQLADI